MNIRLMLAAILFLNVIISSAAAQSVLSEGAKNFWGTWFNVPSKYLVSWSSIISFVVAPIVIAMFLVYEVWKELGIFHSGAANFWIPALVVYMALRSGFWDFVDMFVTRSASFGMLAPILFAAMFSLKLAAVVRRKASSYGYSGIFNGVMAYLASGLGIGFFFGSLGFAFDQLANNVSGRIGPITYVAFFAGAGFGFFSTWWDKRGKKTGNLKNSLEQEGQIEKELAVLEAQLLKLNKESDAAPNPETRGIIEDEMVAIKRRMDRLRAKEEVVADKTD